MSGVTVSVSLTKAQQGKLYMQNMQRGDRIKALKAGLLRVIELAEASGNFEIATAAKAALEPATPEAADQAGNQGEQPC
jgi:hypothetical protein